MIIVATDAPLDHRNLLRLAKRAMLGLGRTGGIASNGSGDYVVAFSTFEQNRVLHQTNNEPKSTFILPNDSNSPLFMAAIEATEEAIINSLFAAVDTKGFKGSKVAALPIQQLLPLFIKEKK
jgi:D-aminopeptidase